MHSLMAVMRARWRSALVGSGIVALAVVLVMGAQERQYTASAVVFVMPREDASQASHGASVTAQSALLEMVHGERVARRVVAAMGLANDAELLAQWRRSAPAGVSSEAWIAAHLGQHLRSRPASLYCAITVSFTSADAHAAAAMANAYANALVEVAQALSTERGRRDELASRKDVGQDRRWLAGVPTVESGAGVRSDIGATVLAIELGAAEANDILHGLGQPAADGRAQTVLSVLESGHARDSHARHAGADGRFPTGPLGEIDRARRACGYLAVRARARTLPVGRSAEGPIVASVHEPATPPAKPSSPDLVLQSTIGLALAAVFGIATPAFRERTDPRLRSLDDIAARLHCRVLAVIPNAQPLPLHDRPPAADSSLPNESQTEPASDLRDRAIGDLLGERCNLDAVEVARIEQYHRTHHLPFGEAARALGLVGPDDVSWALAQQFHYAHAHAPTAAAFAREQVVVLVKPNGQRARVFRDLRTQVMQSMAASAGPGAAASAIAVMSANSGEGRSYVAANLAAASSQFGRRTLLVDADVRHPMQHEIFGIDGAGGLLTILDGRLQANLLHSVPGLPGLYVLPAGSAPSDPLSLLQLPTLDLLLRELGQRFDAVILDTPPFARGPTAMKIAERCGAALIVGRIGTARLHVLDRLVGALEASRVRPLGLVVNPQ